MTATGSDKNRQISLVRERAQSARGFLCNKPDCFAEARNDERMITNLTTDEADLTRISNIRQSLMLKFNPQHKAYRVTRLTQFVGSLCILLQARVNKTVKHLADCELRAKGAHGGVEPAEQPVDPLNASNQATSYRPNVLTTSNNVTAHSPFTTHHSRKRCAFTLAEVLITLGIIGIVAAMTIPNLIPKFKEKETVAKLKKTYSILQQAQQLSIAEYGTLDTWGLGNTSIGDNKYDFSSSESVRDIFAKHLKVMKTCDKGNNCLGKPVYYLSGQRQGTYSDPSIILNDGTKIFFGWTYSACSKNRTCTAIGIVIPNGNADKYTKGKDIFYFTVYSDRIVPMGNTYGKLSDTCSNSGDGDGCASWVIYNENMDYLHCNDLEWDKKTKCK